MEFVNCVSFRSLLRKECKHTVHEKCAQFYSELAVPSWRLVMLVLKNSEVL